MNKIIILMLVVVFLVGCGAKPQFVCPDGSVVDSSDQCVVGEAEEEPEVVEEEPKVVEEVVEEKKEMSAEVSELISKIDKVEKYSYVYNDGEKELYKYTVVGDKILMEPILYEELNLDEDYGFIYIDTVKKTAYAACGAGRCDFSRDTAIELDYKDVKFETPTELLKSLEYVEKGSTTVMIENTRSIPLEYEDGAKKVVVYVHNFYSMPMEVHVIGDDTEITSFNQMSINPVLIKEEVVEIPETITNFI